MGEHETLNLWASVMSFCSLLTLTQSAKSASKKVFVLALAPKSVRICETVEFWITLINRCTRPIAIPASIEENTVVVTVIAKRNELIKTGPSSGKATLLVFH